VRRYRIGDRRDALAHGRAVPQSRGANRVILHHQVLEQHQNRPTILRPIGATGHRQHARVAGQLAIASESRCGKPEDRVEPMNRVENIKQPTDKHVAPLQM
jgi:hypothetical protein